MERSKRSFWTTLPGIITAVAALITALGGVVGVHAIADGTIGGSTAEPVPSTVELVRNGDAAAAVRDATPPSVRGDERPLPLNTTSTTAGLQPTTTKPVAEATLRADPFEYAGVCPVTINFTGRISALTPNATVSYRFERSDGATGPVQSVTFSSPGSKPASTSWQLGASGINFDGWETLVVLSPQALRSDKASFPIRCT